MPAHIYLRVSTDEQAEEGYSLQAQERACRLFCDLQGVAVAHVWTDEGYSGTNARRPAFLGLLANVQRGDSVLVHKLDRFTRNTRLLLESLEQLERDGARLISVSEQIDFSSPIGKVILTILSAFSQFYVDNLRQETIKGLREKAQQGLWVGPTPFGYAKIDKGRLVPNEHAPTVRLIFSLYVERGLSFSNIASELHGRNLGSPKSPWGRENVRGIVRSRAYIGMVSSGGVEYPGQHEPLVSAEIFAAAAAQRQARSVEPNGGPRAPAHLVDLIYCARCGGKLWFTYGGRGLDTRSYYCGRRSCTAPQFRVELVEAAIIDLVELLAITLADLPKAIQGVYVEEGEIIYIYPTPPYRRLLQRLGYQLRDPAASEK